MNLYKIYHKWCKNANGFSLVGEKEKDWNGGKASVLSLKLFPQGEGDEIGIEALL
jgi:hypothetical protein